MTSNSFEANLEQLLAPPAKPGEVVLTYKLSAHDGAGALLAIEAHGADLEHLPPHSPELNPIQKYRSKVKVALRRAKPRTLVELLDTMADSSRAVIPRGVT